MLRKKSVLLALFLLSIPGLAAPVKPKKTTEQALVANEPSISNTTYVVSIGASVFLGFGLGQATQDRWSSAGWPFTIIDGAFYITLLSQMGDSQSGSRSNLSDGARNTIIGVYAVSRVVQLVETVVWGAGHLKNTEPETVGGFIAPAGVQASALVAGMRFSF